MFFCYLESLVKEFEDQAVIAVKLKPGVGIFVKVLPSPIQVLYSFELILNFLEL